MLQSYILTWIHTLMKMLLQKIRHVWEGVTTKPRDLNENMNLTAQTEVKNAMQT